MADVIMPKMSDAMTEGKVLAWRKHVGDKVRRGETIAEIETDKVNVEIDAEVDGTLSDIVVPDGGTAAVGDVIAHINGAERRAEQPPRPRPAAAGAKPSADGKAAAPPQAEKSGTAPQSQQDKTAVPTPSRPPAAAPSRPTQGAETVRPAREPTGRDGPRETEPHRDGELPKASPLAKRLAAEHGIDLTVVRGTGPGGRIVERDVLAAAEGASAARPDGRSPGEERGAGAPAAAPETARREAPVTEPQAGSPRPGDHEDVELPRMRQAIALSVARSMQVTPHFYVSGEIDMRRALDVRAQLKAAYGDDEGRVTVNDLVLKAAALALRRHPDLNAQFIEPKTLRRFHRVHLGIMVAVPDGLLVPVLRDAERRSLLQVARESRRLIEAAKRGQLRYEEYTGATFSVTNLGMYPVMGFAAIINAPQAGILAVGRVEDRAVMRDGQVVGRPVMAVTISADHRVTDGVGAAVLLGEVKRLLENPVLLMAE